MADPLGVSIAFDDPPLTVNPAWTRIDTLAGCRVRDWTIDRGRPTEFDKTGTGTAVVNIVDRQGLFDPTNATSPYNGKIRPGKQAGIALVNPTGAHASFVLFRGFVESWHYRLAPTEKWFELELQLVDGFAVLSRAELRVGIDGDLPVPKGSEGNVVYGETLGTVKDRIDKILLNVGWPNPGLTDAFSGNVQVGPKVYSPGTSALDALWDAADGEFPGVANLWMSKDGKLTFRGRQARFRPDVAEYGIQRRTVGDSSATPVSGVKGPPLFTEEGPKYYAAAFAHNEPFSRGSPFKTTLTSGQETAFRAWVTANSVPFDPNEDPTDYDMRGFYKASVIDNTIPDWVPGAHFPDTYKTPYDTTFSKDSQYATVGCPFEWITDATWGDLLVDNRDLQIIFGPPGAAAIVRVAELEWVNGHDSLFNSASATPERVGTSEGSRQWNTTAPDNDDQAAQTFKDDASIAAYGLSSITFDNLQTILGKAVPPGNDAKAETLGFAKYYVQNYGAPAPRLSRLVFKSRSPDDPYGPALWTHMCQCEISDLLRVRTSHPGGGGFDQDFYVEGLHYTGRPGTPTVPIVELSLDVSPRAHYTTNPFPDDHDPP